MIATYANPMEKICTPATGTKEAPSAKNRTVRKILVRPERDFAWEGPELLPGP